MKKMIITVMLSILCLSLVACGDDMSDSGNPTPPSQSVDKLEETPDNQAVSEQEPSDISEANKGIRPEFKETMDRYEVFFNEYVSFMQKYNESDDALSMMTDYSDFLERYTEAMEQLSEIESQEISNEELAYYTEVMLRINQKLLEVQ